MGVEGGPPWVLGGGPMGAGGVLWMQGGHPWVMGCAMGDGGAYGCWGRIWVLEGAPMGAVEVLHG